MKQVLQVENGDLILLKEHHAEVQQDVQDVIVDGVHSLPGQFDWVGLVSLEVAIPVVLVEPIHTLFGLLHDTHGLLCNLVLNSVMLGIRDRRN